MADAAGSTPSSSAPRRSTRNSHGAAAASAPASTALVAARRQSSTTTTAAATAAAAAAASSSSSSSSGTGGGAGGGAGASASASASSSSATALAVTRRRRRPRTARPSELTKNGIRQYVESLEWQVRIYLQNCVATVNLQVPPDLAHVATHARNVEYNPKRFSAAVMRLRDPKTTALLFRSGKMVLTGAKNEDNAQLAGRKITRIMQRLGYSNARFSEFKIQNIVGTCDVGFPIQLEGMADGEHGRYSCYEPELFPGLIYRMQKPKVVLLVFVSGKVVLTGGKSRIHLLEAFNKIYPVLREFRKAPVAT